MIHSCETKGKKCWFTLLLQTVVESIELLYVAGSEKRLVCEAKEDGKRSILQAWWFRFPKSTLASFSLFFNFFIFLKYLFTFVCAYVFLYVYLQNMFIHVCLVGSMCMCMKGPHVVLSCSPPYFGRSSLPLYLEFPGLARLSYQLALCTVLNYLTQNDLKK